MLGPACDSYIQCLWAENWASVTSIMVEGQRTCPAWDVSGPQQGQKATKVTTVSLKKQLSRLEAEARVGTAAGCEENQGS